MDVNGLERDRRVVLRAGRERVEEHHGVAAAGQADRDAKRLGAPAVSRNGFPGRQRRGDGAGGRVGDI